MKETKDKTQVYLARMIQEQRLMLGMSLYQVAKQTGISEGHLSKIERGMNIPRADILHKICLALNLQIIFPLPI